VPFVNEIDIRYEKNFRLGGNFFVVERKTFGILQRFDKRLSALICYLSTNTGVRFHKLYFIDLKF
jgi:hypothetical protein